MAPYYKDYFFKLIPVVLSNSIGTSILILFLSILSIDSFSGLSSNQNTISAAQNTIMYPIVDSGGFINVNIIAIAAGNSLFIVFKFLIVFTLLLSLNE